MDLKSCLLLVVCAVFVFLEVKAEKEKLQIGIRKKIPDDECHIRSRKGDTLHMNYKGKLVDGTVFDSSTGRGQPFIFEIGAGQAIQGWELGLLDMCIGEQRKLVIPPHLAYGDRGASGVIPPGATLYMNVECIKIIRNKAEL